MRISGKSIEVVTDPQPGTKFKADVVTLTAPTESGHEFARPENTLVIDGPGEYEVRGSMIVGVPTKLMTDDTETRGTAYALNVDGLNVAVVGNVSGKLSDSQLEALGQIDILVVPVGGGGLTLDAEGAAAVVAQIEPSWIVPVHFEDGVSKYPVPQDKVELFLKEMGVNPEPVNKFRASAKDPVAETQVVLLSRVN